MSGNIDFWTDPHRKESYGALVVDLTAHKFDMTDGQTLFMSKRTQERLDNSMFVTGQPILAPLEFPLNFERFTDAKTVENVSEWMFSSIRQARLRNEDFNQWAADGGSNAIGSIQEVEVVARAEEGRSNSQEFNVCYSHQNERSGGYASGAIKFADEPNVPLGNILRKNHEIQVSLNRSGKRLEIFEGIQENKGRMPLLGPKSAGETRWQGMLLVFHILYSTIPNLLYSS